MATVEEGLRALEDITALSRKMVSDMNKELNDSEKKILEYFWNSKKKEIRKIIPEEVVIFFENEKLDEYLRHNTPRRVKYDMSGLVNKHYLNKVEDDNKAIFYGLTLDGMAYLKDKHPDYIVFFDRMLERTPNILKLLIGLIGLIASVFGIIQFFHDIVLKK